jgi:hypothetical protein
LFKLLTTNGTWQQLLRNKYLGSKPLLQVEWKNGDSHFWSSLIKVKRDFFRFGSFIVKDGTQVRFWEDKWLGNSSLQEQFPCLYNIARPKHVTIAEVLSGPSPNLSWRRDLIGPKLIAWNNLLPRIANIELAHEQDEFYWNLHPNGKFSVKSHYQGLLHTDIPNINKLIWKVKAPLKIKIFMWYLRRGVILTKDNLVKRNWQGSKTCCFCHKEEIIKHLFFDCRFACSIWSFIQVVTGLLKHYNIGHMFNGWLRGVNKDVKLLLLLGGAATCWSIWFSKNDIVFEKKKICLSCAGYLFGYPLATYLGYYAEAGFAGYSCSGIATTDAGGQ